MLFGFNSRELRAVPRVFCYLLNVVKYCLGLSRNDFRFHGIRPGAVTVLESVRVRVRFYLHILFKRFSSPRRRRFFVRQWGACNVVVSVIDGRLVMHIYLFKMANKYCASLCFIVPSCVIYCLWSVCVCVLCY